MCIKTVAAIACGGALGALSRFSVVALIQSFFRSRFPLGTLAVNCLGSFLIGLIMYWLMERYVWNAETWRLFLVVGFLGAFTTFSSFAWETWVLYSDGLWGKALINIVVNNFGTLILVLLGIHTGRLIGG